MHMKNNASTLTAYKWKLPNVTEWNVDPESVKDLCKLWDTDGSHLLHLCFDNITEYDPDVILLFDKNAIFSPFCSKCSFFFYETNLHWSVDKKTMLEAKINPFCLKVRGLIFILIYCMIRYSYNKIFWAPLDFTENQQKHWRWLATFFKNAGGERVKQFNSHLYSTFH